MEKNINISEILKFVSTDNLTKNELVVLRKLIIEKENEMFLKQKKLVYEIEFDVESAHCFKKIEDATKFLVEDIVKDPNEYWKESNTTLKTRFIDFDEYNERPDIWIEV
jgi:hypothetical protein